MNQQYSQASGYSQYPPPQQYQPPQQLLPPPQEPYTSTKWIETPQGLYDSNPGRYLSMNCLDIANHIKYCVVCQKLYSCDKNLYLLVIVTLIVVIAMLIRRIVQDS